MSRDWRALGHEQRIAAAAALALLVTMVLPWYQQNFSAVVGPHHETPQLESRNLNAFQVFSFIEAAVLLVALAVGYLLYARAGGREFRLPGSDGTIVFIAGLWAGALLVLRLFDKPGISGHAGNVGVQWGIFFALAAAGALAYAGSRMRVAQLHPDHHHRAHLPHRAGEGHAAPSAPTAQTRAPAHRFDPAPAAGGSSERRSAPVPAARSGEEPTAAVQQPPPRPRYPPAPPDQMSFEDPPRER